MSLFLHAVAGAGKGRVWGLSPMRDDGTMVEGGRSDKSSWVEMKGALNLDGELVGEYCAEEVDPVRGKAFADSVNNLLGFGFAEPWRRDTAAPGQKLIELSAR